jgi:glutamate dehydrogenase (NAD(P)+)
VAAAAKHKEETGSFKGFSEATELTICELIASKTDVLIPAALSGQIDAEAAQVINAKMLVEAANDPTTGEADKILSERGIFVIPDILANAGGVVVSYFEWIQDLQWFFWDEDEICKKLTKIMQRAFADVLATANKYKCDMRTAALCVGARRVAAACKDRGLYP